MKIILKKSAGLFIMAAFLFMLAPVNALAASTVLSISKSDIKTGDDFTVTISGAVASNLSLHYDGTMVTLKSQGNATLNGNTLTINGKSASFAFTAKKSGSAGFVASSDKYARSSVLINIGEGEASSAEETKASESEAAAAKTDDTSSDNTSEKTSDNSSEKSKDTKTASTEKKTDSTKAADSTAASNDSASDTSSDTTDVYPFSSADLSLKELILDRRVAVIIGALAAVIVVLVIMLLWTRYSVYRDFDEDDDMDTERDGLDVKEQSSPETKPDKPDFSDEDETDKLYERLKEGEKLSMPKTPVVPEKKLHLEDLNDL